MTKKGWITLLLAVCCAVSFTLHAQIEPGNDPVLYSASQIDSLIAQTTYDFQIPSGHVTVQSVRHDSIFQRKIYTIDVPPEFSKTTFHHHLNSRLTPLNVRIYGSVKFPEKDLMLNLLYNETVHRTIHLETASNLSFERTTIPRLPD